MKLAFSTNAFKQNSVDEAVDEIARIGYGAVEIMADVPHAYPKTFGPENRSKLRSRIADRGLVVSNINAFTLFACGDTYHPTWIEHDSDKRQLRVEHTLAAIELAAEMGCRTVSLQPGGPLIATGLSPDIAAERYAEGLHQVLSLAKKLNITLGIEPEPGLMIQSAGEYAAFKRRYFRDEPAVRMNCDVGHLFCVGEDPAQVIRELADDVIHVHLEDIGDNRVHQHLTPGRGVIDFSAIFAALRDIRYDGWMTVELYPYETSAAGVARRAYDHLGKIH
ncbi:MAG: sugar phosphate isomerase/epimerase [Phycisphaerales bacterium]|nr:sugar phosphate isomerase/epimerase [Phycisphaerales bacterium]